MTSRRWTILAAILGLVLLGGLLYIVAMTYGGPAAQLRALEANQEKWSSQGAFHYRFQVHVACFCPFADRMPLTVEVRNGAIVAAVDQGGSALAVDDPLRTLMDGDFLTVEGLFAYARRAIKEADKIEITYDPALGYPTSINVDWIELAIDDEMAVQAGSLDILP